MIAHPRSTRPQRRNNTIAIMLAFLIATSAAGFAGRTIRDIQANELHAKLLEIDAERSDMCHKWAGHYGARGVYLRRNICILLVSEKRVLKPYPKLDTI